MTRENRLLAARLRRFRANRQLSVRELSLITDVSPRTIKRIEASDLEDQAYDAKLSTISKLGRGLNVSLEELTQ